MAAGSAPRVASLEVTVSDDATAAWRDAEAFLVARPAPHNVVLTLLAQRMARPEPGRYRTVRRDGEVVAFALQSPPDFPAVLATGGDVDREAMEALADAFCADGGDLPGVIGEAGPVACLAGAWSERRPVPVVPVEGQRIYRLADLRPATGVPGRLRPAEPADVEVLASWRTAFHHETGGGGPDPRGEVEADLDAGRLFVWDDGGTMASARVTEPVAGLARVGYVYTPPSRRRRGYAAALVGAVCAWVASHDGAGCVLFTQLTNPGANRMYRHLGFTAVTEVLAYRFGPAAGGE